MSVKDILKPKSGMEVWRALKSQHYTILLGIPMMLIGICMAITLFTCIPGKSYTSHHTMQKVDWLKATGDSTYVNHIPMPPLELIDETLKKHVRDSISSAYHKEVTAKDWVTLEIKVPEKEQPTLPKIFNKNITFFKRLTNIITAAILILTAIVFFVIPIIVWSKRYGDDDNYNNRY